VTALELGPFQARAVILACEQTGAALLVDPGFDPDALLAEVRRDRLEPAAIVLTHAHLDHAWGVAAAHDAFFSVPVLLHADDLPLYRNLAGQAQMFGFPPPRTVPESASLADGQELTFGRLRVVVRHAPGHSPGHVVLIHSDPEQPTAVVGDVLFAGSVGRTDLWGGSFPQLERSIREVLYRLPGHTRVVPGHGPETTIAAEIAGNPFVSG
jgi:glyoxylase-like metal-dependent hydrolase (beta-lactamase superfamily II)